MLPDVELEEGIAAASACASPSRTRAPAGLDLTLSAGVAAAAGRRRVATTISSARPTGALLRAKRAGRNRVGSPAGASRRRSCVA